MGGVGVGGVQREGSRGTAQWRVRQCLLKQRARGWGLSIYKQPVLMGQVVFPAVIILGDGATKVTGRHVNSQMGSPPSPAEVKGVPCDMIPFCPPQYSAYGLQHVLNKYYYLTGSEGTSHWHLARAQSPPSWWTHGIDQVIRRLTTQKLYGLPPSLSASVSPSKIGHCKNGLEKETSVKWLAFGSLDPQNSQGHASAGSHSTEDAEAGRPWDSPASQAVRISDTR